MKLKDIKNPLFVLLEDAHSAEQFLDENDTQFARRASAEPELLTVHVDLPC